MQWMAKIWISYSVRIITQPKSDYYLWISDLECYAIKQHSLSLAESEMNANSLCLFKYLWCPFDSEIILHRLRCNFEGLLSLFCLMAISGFFENSQTLPIKTNANWNTIANKPSFVCSLYESNSDWGMPTLETASCHKSNSQSANTQQQLHRTNRNYS